VERREKEPKNETIAMILTRGDDLDKGEWSPA
jgi:hypothetical protein